MVGAVATLTRQTRQSQDYRLGEDEKMKSQFLSFGYTQTLFQQLHALRQGARSVDGYIEEFYQLITRNDLLETEEQVVELYLGGLR